MKHLYLLIFFFTSTDSTIKAQFVDKLQINGQSEYQTDIHENVIIEKTSTSNLWAWDVSKLENSGIRLNTSDKTSNARSIDLVDNDTRLYVHSRGSQNVVMYELTIPGDISSAIFINEFDTTPYLGTKSESSVGHGFYIERENMERVWLWNRTEVWQFDLSIPGDMSTANFSGYQDLSSIVTRGHDITFRHDGMAFYVEDRNQEAVHQFSIPEAWNIGSIEWVYSLDISARHEEVRGIEFDPFGSIMYLLDTSLQEIQQYILSEPWQISTAKLEKTLSINISNPRGLTWNSDGTSAYVMDASNRIITQYNISDVPATVELIAPTNLKKDLSIPVKLQWQSFENANYYEVQISESDDFTNIINEYGIDGTTYNTVLDDTTGYFWRVRARVDQQKTQWSDVWTFKTELRVPEIPLWNSENDDVVSTIPKLYWTKSARAETFRFQLSDQIDFSSKIIDANGIENISYQITEELISKKKYYWRIRAGNERGYSNWSDIWSFTTVVEPKAVILKSPGNEANLNSAPTLNWDNSDNASAYHLQLSKKADFKDPLIDTTEIDTTTYLITEELESGVNYFWRVRARNENLYGDWSEIYKFVLEVSTSNDRSESPLVHKLHQNYPNPFNPVTNIQFSLPEPSHVRVEIYNTLGQHIATLLNEHKDIGMHEINFDASGFSTGIYLYRMQTSSYTKTKQMMLIK